MKKKKKKKQDQGGIDEQLSQKVRNARNSAVIGTFVAGVYGPFLWDVGPVHFRLFPH